MGMSVVHLVGLSVNVGRRRAGGCPSVAVTRSKHGSTRSAFYKPRLGDSMKIKTTVRWLNRYRVDSDIEIGDDEWNAMSGIQQQARLDEACEGAIRLALDQYISVSAKAVIDQG